MNRIMVCVTGQKTCQRLIDYGKQLQESPQDPLYVIHVAGESYHFLGRKEEGEALEFLFQKAREAGAELTVTRSSNVMETLLELVEKHRITSVVAGQSREEDGGFLDQFAKALPEGTGLWVVPAVS
ncbi:MAG: universal stress protein [Emergencia sp.]